jgi:hypothetical protein
MATHWLVIPAAGGDGTTGNPESINLQWALFPYSGNIAHSVSLPILTAEAAGVWVQAPALAAAPKLVECYASFNWTAEADGSSLTHGGALTVGTVFQTNRIGTLSTPGITPFAKIKVSNVNRLSAVFIQVADRAGNIILASPTNHLGGLSNGTWAVISDDLSDEFDALEDLDNLRIQVSFLGVLNGLPLGQQAGQIICDVEWLSVEITVV